MPERLFRVCVFFRRRLNDSELRSSSLLRFTEGHRPGVKRPFLFFFLLVLLNLEYFHFDITFAR